MNNLQASWLPQPYCVVTVCLSGNPKKWCAKRHHQTRKPVLKHHYANGVCWVSVVLNKADNDAPANMPGPIASLLAIPPYRKVKACRLFTGDDHIGCSVVKVFSCIRLDLCRGYGILSILY
ncbi:MAG: hypothetical protein ACXWT3_10330 [Methylococcaceae bacterium]